MLDGHQDEFPAVAAPALFAPNSLGFYDFAGNVSEWVNDRYLSFVPSVGRDGSARTRMTASSRVSRFELATVATVELRFPGAKAPRRPAT